MSATETKEEKDESQKHEIQKISTGAEVLNFLLNGGFESDVITTIYGPAGSGKSCICMLSAIEIVKKGKKVLYVDTEGGFSVERLKQVDNDYKKNLEKIIFFKPATFAEQRKAFEKLKNTITDTKGNLGLIIVDSIAMLYRLEIGQTKDISEVNREMGLQLAYLGEIARKKKIPVLLTNQVYANFEDASKVNLVGGDLLKYASKCLIELRKLHKGRRVAKIVKHRSIPEDKEVLFEIQEKGIVEGK